MGKVTIELTIDQCESLIDFFESNLLDAIRNDKDIDSIWWLCNVCEVYRETQRKLTEFKKNSEKAGES